MTKSQTIPASEARNNFSDLISKVQYQGQEFLIERYGEIVAKLVPVEVKKEQVVTEQPETTTFDTTPEQVTPPPATQSSEQVIATTINDQAEVENEVVDQGQENPTEEDALRSLRELSQMSENYARETQSSQDNNSNQSQKEERLEIIKKRIQLMMK